MCSAASEPSLPPTSVRVGVVGGGQLGQMMALAAHRLGVKLTCLDPGGLASPTGKVCGAAVTGGLADGAAIRKLAAEVDVLTVEIEHIDTASLAAIEAEGKVAVHPSPRTLATIQDKLLQKRHLSTVDGVSLGDFCDVPDAAALLAAGETWGYPLMLKARTLAYDGRGNAVVRSAAEAESAFSSLSRGGAVPLYAERWAEFVSELAVMVARARDGTVVTYPLTVTEQRDSMCHTVVAPAPVAASVSEQALAVARKAISSLWGAGIFGVELFHMKDGSVLLNEIAPRPHNSGHYTMDACVTEQHEMHLRCVAGLPLGDTSMKVVAAAMYNVIGSADGKLSTTLAAVDAALAMPCAALHWYGKAPPKPRRKMAHVNLVGGSRHEVAIALRKLEAIADAANGAPVVSIIMGSDSDLPCMKAAAEVLEQFGVAYEITIVSAHRTPSRMYEFAREADARGVRVIIAGAGGAAHLPGMVAALTPLPVIGVPVKSSALSGNDSLLSIVQMPRGVPVATVAIHNAANAGLLAVRTLGAADPTLRRKMAAYMESQEAEVLCKADKLEKGGFRAYLDGA
ncbi:hypothetical protein EMIHUDRAFT_421581 [Emiliania huxleyi CCMP1516]|uniref:phosphoribosylaminoimidazole carboxylase n=2 Tax=Emiliania huxleyi TaxID=2903 RepID=A0A0D3JBR0_EMIH1|nr:hypothetical protein EMIHUDRAFT_421581 [Emiliania huxleyi CCMP1516]EOD20945.1 hypothetical protein EMIHUDRAFT_421581 [Emiliania huxleyi CCMP1516]|eukprot:XP_005773374.1 hypothetical protein EMIHUDRAFT_421581 [Emiliania huxleyi CCMP1516]